MFVRLWAPYSSWSLGRYCERALQQLGHTVAVSDFRARPLTNADISGDLVFVVKGNRGILPLLGKVRGKKALWFPDDPHGDGLSEALAPHFHFVFTCHKPYIQRYEAIRVKAFWLPPACDPDVHKPFPLPKSYDFVFVGHIDPRRRQFFDWLSRSFSVYARSGIFLEDMSKAYCSGKVGINISKTGEITMRVFEVMACNVLLFTDSLSNNLSELLTPNQHFIVYNQGNVISLGRKFLGNEALREGIAKAGGELVRTRHTYKKRMQEVIRVCFG